MLVPGERLEEATATMLELFPEGFVEERRGDSVELAAFTDEAGADLLGQRFGRVATEPVSPGWEDEWKRFHRPVEVGPLWIGPPWERPAAGLEPVVIDPGRAFGTGAHPTTRLCVELLLELDRGSVLDIGCGSGVLAIAACKLGFGPVAAVDSDQAAVEAATRNARGERRPGRGLLARRDGRRTAGGRDRAREYRSGDARSIVTAFSTACARHVRLLRERAA